EAEDVFYAYLEIFTLLIEEMRVISRDEDVLYLPDLNTYKKKLFDGDMMPVSEFYCRLATRFSHYLIDEFQDTSRLQWRNIYPFVDEALSSRGSFFYVGDKKQAIYRFRGGDLTLFDSVTDQLSFFKSQTRKLTKNYRSQKEIVEFNNRIFSEDNLSAFIDKLSVQDKGELEIPGPQKAYLLKNFKGSYQEVVKGKDSGFVKLVPVDGNSVEETNSIVKEQLLALIKSTLNRFQHKDIAILARDNRDVKEITAWLIEESIPVESEKTLNMRYHPIIKELISFLKFLDAPTDNLSLASFLMGDIFLKATGLSRDTVCRFVFDNKKNKREEKNVYLYKRFKDSFPDIWNTVVADFFKSVGYVPVYELLVSILKRYSVMEHFSQYQAFVMGFLEFVKEKEDEYSGIGTFVCFFEKVEERELYIQVVESNAVNITTIHKAKGLEFGVVIVSFVEINIGVGSGGGSSRKPYVVESVETGELRLLQLKKEYNKFSESLSNKFMLEYSKSLIDELNALYVAFSRAADELYLFLPKKAANKRNFARLLFPSEDYESGVMKSCNFSDLKLGEKICQLPLSEYSDWIGILKEDFVKVSELSNRGSIKRGKIMHRILSFIGNLTNKDKAAILEKAEEALLYEFPEVVEISEYIKKASNLVEEDFLKPFFYCGDAEVFQERVLVDAAGNTRIVDRLIVYADEAWVIDYKSSKVAAEDNLRQVREYVEIVKSMYPKNNVKGFLIYFDTFDIETVCSIS
ncbi:MAG: 3'-5' exonuclease, partial [Candidatus Omnitrophota bacterium]